MRSIRPSAKQYYVMGLPDPHIGYVVDTPTYSIGAWDVAMQAMRYLRKRLTHVVFFGDVGNWEPLSHWQSLRADQGFIEEDVALVNARLDEVQALAQANDISVVMIEGNHEAWASQFEAKYPALRDMCNLQRRLCIKERGWTWVPENHFWAIGEAYFTHGHVRGVRSPADMVRLKGVSVLYAHTHGYKTESMRTLQGEMAAWTCGCLASIDPPPPYTRGELPNTWVQGFPLVQVRANGLFQVSFRRILEEAWTELEDGTEIIASAKNIKARRAADEKVRKQMRKEYGERYYCPGGSVKRTEPHHGKMFRGEVSPVARNRRARIVRTLPDGVRGGNI